MSSKDDETVVVQEEPDFDWTEWADPLTDAEKKQMPTEDEWAKVPSLKDFPDFPQRE